MKMLKYVSLNILLIMIVTTGNAQVEPESPPDFSNIRSKYPTLFHDFGKIKETPVSHTFKIKNTGDLVMDIVDIDFPAKIAISFMGFHIKPGEEGTFIITVNPSFMEKGIFNYWGVITIRKNDSGKSITEKIKFNIAGEVL